MCVLYTGAKTLFTAANVNVNEHIAVHITTDCFGLCATYASVSGHGMKPCENILSDFI